MSAPTDTGLPPALDAAGSLKERVKRAAQVYAQKRAEEAADPLLADTRRRTREAELARARAEHQARLRDEAFGFLTRAGVLDDDAERILKGLDARWGQVTREGRTYSALSEARDWWTSPEHVLLLLGTNGTGKSLAALSLFLRCRFGYVHPDMGETWCWPATADDSPLYVQAPQLATRPLYGLEAEKKRSALYSCRLLVVDELGREVLNDGWKSVVQDLVNHRAHGRDRDQKRPLKTVLVSNLGEARFWERYGMAVRRRVEEHGRVVVLGGQGFSASAPREAPARRDVSGAEGTGVQP